eukprot:GFYU01000386.1.p1 GENE.GFYU01000386.1~~GFYU01000386.1.p1  ORF type:complete len:334 (-),score=38.67 GFYU01000386.1:208-1209(-)
MAPRAGDSADDNVVAVVKDANAAAYARKTAGKNAEKAKGGKGKAVISHMTAEKEWKHAIECDTPKRVHSTKKKVCLQCGQLYVKGMDDVCIYHEGTKGDLNNVVLPPYVEEASFTRKSYRRLRSLNAAMKKIGQPTYGLLNQPNQLSADLHAHWKAGNTNFPSDMWTCCQRYDSAQPCTVGTHVWEEISLNDATAATGHPGSSSNDSYERSTRRPLQCRYCNRLYAKGMCRECRRHPGRVQDLGYCVRWSCCCNAPQVSGCVGGPHFWIVMDDVKVKKLAAGKMNTGVHAGGSGKRRAKATAKPSLKMTDDVPDFEGVQASAYLKSLSVEGSR